MKKNLLLAFALIAFVPVGIDAQDLVIVGDWVVQESQDPFDDSKITLIALAVEDATTYSSGIQNFAIRCGVGGPGLSLFVGHSYMGGDDGEMRLTYRLGDAPARTVTAYLTSDNEGTVHDPIEFIEVSALLSSPRVAVRIVDLLDNETHQENWANLEGTREALETLHCFS